MKWFYNLKISAKLLTAFILVALIAGIVGFVGIINIENMAASDTEMYKINTIPLGQIGTVGMDFHRSRISMRDAILANDDAEIKKYTDKTNVYFEDLQKQLAEFEKSIQSGSTGDKLRSEYKNLASAIERFKPIQQQILQSALNGDDAETMKLLRSDEAARIVGEVEVSIDNLRRSEEDLATEKSGSNSKNAAAAQMVMITLMIIGVAIAVGLGLVISGMISKPVRKMVEAADKLAVGDVNVDIRSDSRDEIGSLMESFSKMVLNIKENADSAEKIAKGELGVSINEKSNKDILAISMKGVLNTLKELIGQMDHMSRQHDAGDIDVVVDAARFEGAYKTMAQGVNDMVAGHITVKKKAMACVAEFSRGNFDVELEKFPGKKAFINENIETLRRNLKDVDHEISLLVNAALEGKLNTRGNTGRFEGGYRNMVKGINDTLDAVMIPLNHASGYISKMASGEELEEINNIYKGDFAILMDNLNKVRTSLYTLLEESAKLTVAGTEGKLSVRGDVSRLKGGYAQIIQGVNDTLDAVIAPVQEAAAVLKEMANGNLQKRVVGNYKGDHAEIKNAMNDTLDTLSSYVSEISNVIGEIADSNLQVEITRDYRGDFIQIKEALNLIIHSLNEVLGEINNASDQVASGSRQVSDGSQALSQGATEQASSIEELTASITEIAAQTRQNAANASQANELAGAARKNAEQGNSHMKEMLRSMEEINESSTNISKIIKVIDEIAFQTNILALNAAVEAARAGQHGKGFAVVAEEVRNLAARSANAAKETTAMIEGSIKKVEAGTKIANETAIALDSIVGGVAKAADLVGEIAAASNEQATGIAQINKGVEQVSAVIQTNSATAEESAAASEELSSQAELLREMVGKFRLKRSAGSGLRRNDPDVRVNTAFHGINETQENRRRTINLDNGFTEAAAAKPRISMKNADFGKY